MTIKKRFLLSYLSAFVISIGSLLLILALVFYLTLNKIPSVTEVYKMITKQRPITTEEEESFITLDRFVKKSPDLLKAPLNEDVVTAIQQIESKGLQVVIRKNEQFTYFSDPLVERSLQAHSPDYELNNFTPAGTLDNAGRLFHYIKQDFRYVDGNNGSFIILKRESNLFEFFTKWGIWITLFIIIVAIFSAWFIIHQLARTTIKPLEKLEWATKSRANSTAFIETRHEQGEPAPAISKEVRQLEDSFGKMWQELQASEKERQRYEDNRKELVANISHDLKTPITAIIGHIKGLQDGVANTDAKRTHYLDVIHNQSSHLNELIDELFLYSKLDLDGVTFNKQPVNFVNYLTHLLEKYQWQATVDLTTQFPSEALWVSIDPIQMNKVISNLIQNSLKFEDKQKGQLSLEVALAFDPQHVYLTVTDNGIGIDPEELAHVFRRFYRTDKSRTPTVKGSGLGLSIVKQINEHHDGHVEIASEIGRYTQITITLPRLKEAHHDNQHFDY